MKTITVSEATCLQLDWLVAQCEGMRVSTRSKLLAVGVFLVSGEGWHAKYTPFQPTKDWSQGGPIADQEEISIDYRDNETQARKWMGMDFIEARAGKRQGLIAAMRCRVLSKLGSTVQVPAELS